MKRDIGFSLLAVVLVILSATARIPAQDDVAVSPSPSPSGAPLPSPASAPPVDFKAIVAWAIKTGAKTYEQGGDPVVIHKRYAADLGLGDGAKDIPAIQKAFGNDKVSLALYVPLDDKLDVVVDFKDASHEVAWRVRRSGIVVQTYSVADNRATPADDSKYMQEFLNYENVFASKMSEPTPVQP